jgi:putative acetyltransferase
MQKSNVAIQRAVSKDAPAIARLFRQSRESSLAFLPTLHTPDEDLIYFSEQVLPDNEVFVARNKNDQVIGFIAFKSEWIHHLYLLPKSGRKGIGTSLLEIAKAQSTRLRLWTFQRNEIARQFYSRHGFLLIAETNGTENEEREPDILFEWTAVPD